MKDCKEVISEAGEIYAWLDEQTNANKAKAGVCSACGKCCDFEAYGHRLYVTTPEMLYFAEKMGTQTFKYSAERSNCHFDGSDAVRRGVETRSKAQSPEGQSI